MSEIKRWTLKDYGREGLGCINFSDAHPFDQMEEGQTIDVYLASDYDALAARVAQLEKDAAWGAHNGGAHQLLKIQHSKSVELYNALREMSPNHAVVVKHYELSPEALSGYASGCSAIDSAAKGSL